jgi:hypothetical protein
MKYEELFKSNSEDIRSTKEAQIIYAGKLCEYSEVQRSISIIHRELRSSQNYTVIHRITQNHAQIAPHKFFPCGKYFSALRGLELDVVALGYFLLVRWAYRTTQGGTK